MKWWIILSLHYQWNSNVKSERKIKWISERRSLLFRVMKLKIDTMLFTRKNKKHTSRLYNFWFTRWDEMRVRFQFSEKSVHSIIHRKLPPIFLLAYWTINVRDFVSSKVIIFNLLDKLRKVRLMLLSTVLLSSFFTTSSC